MLNHCLHSLESIFKVLLMHADKQGHGHGVSYNGTS